MIKNIPKTIVTVKKHRFELVNGNKFFYGNFELDLQEKGVIDLYKDSAGVNNGEKDENYSLLYKFAYNANLYGKHKIYYGNNFTYFSKFYKSFLWGYAYEIGDSYKYKISFENGIGYRFPTLPEKYWDSGLVAGNNKLLPEKANNSKINFGFNAEDFNLNLSFFYNEIENLIFWHESAMAWKPDNKKNDVIIKGIDLNGNYSLFLWKDYFAGFSFSGLYMKTLNCKTDFKLPFKPEWIYTIDFSFEKENIFGNKISFRYVDERYPTDDGFVELIREKRGLRDYYLFNYSFWYKWKNVKLSLDIENIFNKYYEEFPKYPNPGRKISVGIKYKI